MLARLSGRPSVGVIAIVAVLLVWVGLAMGQVNDLLGAMHPADTPSFTASDVNHLLNPGPDVDRAANVLQVWKAHDVPPVPAVSKTTVPPDARELVTLFAILDSFGFVPLYALLFVLYFRRIELGADTRLHQLARAGRWVALGAAAADLVENLGLVLTVRRGWTSLLDVHPEAVRGALTVLWVGSWAKWLLVGAMLAIAALTGWVLFTGLVAPRREAAMQAARRAHVTAVHVGVVLFAIVFFNQQGQVADLYRRWQAPQALLSLLFVAFAGFAVWAVTRRLLVRGTHPPWEEDRERRAGRVLFGGLWVAALAQTALHVRFDDARLDPGWGLLVPAVMLSVLAVLGWRIPKDEVDAAHRERSTAAAASTSGPTPVIPRVLATALVIGFAYAILRSSFGYAVYTRQWDWARSVGLLALAAGGFGAGAVVRRRIRRPNGGLLVRMLLEPVTWAVGATLGGIALFTPWSGSQDIPPALLVVMSGLLLVGALRWYVAMGHEELPHPQLKVPFAVLALTAGMVVPLGIAVFPLWTGQQLSVPGVIAAFIGAFVLLAGALSWIATWIPQPRALRALRLAAFPVTTFLLTWFVAASFFDHDGAFHDARLKHKAANGSALPAAAPTTAQDGLSCWLARHGLATPVDLPPPTGSDCSPLAEETPHGAVPLIVVASTGGGIRSAYWTATVLDCAFEVEEGPPGAPPCPTSSRRSDFRDSDSLFALSGVSGGSVGIAEYATHLVTKEKGVAHPNWVRESLEVDGLSPSGARWLFVEIPRVFLQFGGPDDRAAILEKAFEAKWDDKAFDIGLFDLARRHPHVPYLLLNATSVGDGCRFNVSVLDLAIAPGDGSPQSSCRSTAPFDEAKGILAPSPATPVRIDPKSVLSATRDLSDLLCLRALDVNVSTASFLSARFPYVNPSGRVASQCVDNQTPSVAHSVDGGYFDTSGASALTELTTALEPMIHSVNADPRNAGQCVVPFMIQIDNGFEESPTQRNARRPPELLVPPKTLADARIGRAAEARTAAALLFTRPLADVRYGTGPVMSRPYAANRYAHFVNEGHPGPGAPFGWAQSRFSQNELVGQIGQTRNVQALAEVRGWFDDAKNGTLACAPG